MKYPQDRLNPKWILEGITPEVAEWAESFGEFLCALEPDRNDPNRMKPSSRALTTNQIRKFFGEVKRIETDVNKYKSDIFMLKPAIAYAIGRDKDERGKSKTRIKEFGDEMFVALDTVNKSDKIEVAFKNFVKVFEAIVAYHKYYGGK